VTLFLELRKMTNRVNHANAQPELANGDRDAADDGVPRDATTVA